MFELNDMLELYDKINEYTYNNSLKPLIISKLKLNEEIKEIEVKIKAVENLIVKSSTINSYNKEKASAKACDYYKDYLKFTEEKLQHP